MKKLVSLILVVIVALLVSGFVEDAIKVNRAAKIDKYIIRPALYGEEYLDRQELLEGRMTWRHSEKLRAEKINASEYKIYIPKAMYKVKARLAEMERY